MDQLYDSAPDEAVYRSVRITLESARAKAAAAVNDAMVSLIGKSVDKSLRRKEIVPNTANT